MKTLKKMKTRTLRVAALVAFIYSSSLFAGDTPVYIHGTIAEPAVCKVNNDQDVNVSFGEIRIDKIDGSNYSRNVNLTVTCTAAPQNTLQMQINGTATDFNNSALTTSTSDLGIQLKQGGSDVTIGGRFNINYPDAVALQAIPVKKPGATLSTGNFTATATAIVNYQ